MKDKVEPLDKTGSVYYNWCKKHKEPKKNDYVGETERVQRKRLYEHRVIDRKTSERAASISHSETEEIEERDKVRSRTETTRRSERLKDKKRKDYKMVSEGSSQLLTEGSTFPATSMKSQISDGKSFAQRKTGLPEG